MPLRPCASCGDHFAGGELVEVGRICGTQAAKASDGTIPCSSAISLLSKTKTSAAQNSAAQLAQMLSLPSVYLTRFSVGSRHASHARVARGSGRVPILMLAWALTLWRSGPRRASFL